MITLRPRVMDVTFNNWRLFIYTALAIQGVGIALTTLIIKGLLT